MHAVETARGGCHSHLAAKGILIERLQHAGPGKTPVPRLSIVIPCVQHAVCFETTLASVLQNRPTDCEVLVVQPRSYDDPYELSGEVRFLEAPAHSSLVDLINAGIRSAEGTIVHVLSTDVEVQDGWTEPALVHFNDPQIGSVAPLVIHRDGVRVVARGVRYGAGGKRQPRLSGPSRRQHILGPTLLAGFYRRHSVLDVGGFCPGVGPQLADIDMGLALHAVGLIAIHEEDSMVVAQQSAAGRQLSFRRGREAERLFWRNTTTTGWIRSLLFHPWTVASELIGNVYRPVVVLQMMGRALAILEFPTYRRHWRKLQAIRAGNGMEKTALPFKDARDSGNDSLLHPRAAA